MLIGDMPTGNDYRDNHSHRSSHRDNGHCKDNSNKNRKRRVDYDNAMSITDTLAQCDTLTKYISEQEIKELVDNIASGMTSTKDLGVLVEFISTLCALMDRIKMLKHLAMLVSSVESLERIVELDTRALQACDEIASASRRLCDMIIVEVLK